MTYGLREIIAQISKRVLLHGRDPTLRPASDTRHHLHDPGRTLFFFLSQK
jgi:hypothetical protein